MCRICQSNVLNLFFFFGNKLVSYSKSILTIHSSTDFPVCPPQCAALVGEDQPLCPDLPELDLSELDVSDLDADSFLGGLKWYSDQSEIISAQYGNEASNLFEVSFSPAQLWPLLLCPRVLFCLGTTTTTNTAL